MSFSDFKKRSKSSIDTLAKKLQEDLGTKKDYKDDRFWRPELDKTGSGYAVIRFLPAGNNEDIPWAKTYTHAFKGKGGWYIENCPTAIGLKCPICEMNNELWNSGIESDKNIARDRKRKLSYISNIVVISDPANPQNDGKVFLFKYGKKIFDKIQEAMVPDFKDEKAVNPFDPWGGSNFRMKIRNVAGYTNYDKSEFDSASALFDGDDKKLEAVWNKLYSLKEFTDPSNFKAYDVLSKKAKDVIGSDIRETSTDDRTVEDEELESAPRPSAAPKKKADPTPEPEEEMDSMSYFEKLANE
jgi:hypothetical protein